MIEGERIWLRPISIQDCHQTLALRLDFEANSSYMGFPYPINEASEERWISSLYPEGPRKRVDFAVEEKQSGELIGLIGASDLNPLHQRAGFGIFIKRESWGKGYAYEAMIIFFRYLFRELNLHRIYLEVVATNERAKTLYERFGFRREGVLRDHQFQHGCFQDVILMGMLREEFETLYPGAEVIQ